MKVAAVKAPPHCWKTLGKKSVVLFVGEFRHDAAW